MNKDLIQKIKKTFEENGVNESEYLKRLKYEYSLNSRLNISEERKEKRAWVAVLNYFRRYLERSANKVKFLCLGVTRPTTYGIGNVYNKRKKLYTKAKYEDNMSMIDGMIEKGEIDQYGNPLYTTDITYKQDQIGKKINVDDSLSQMLIGVIEDENGKRYPGLVRVYGSTGCNEPKYLYKWTKLFGKKGMSNKYPTYYVMDTNEVNMKIVDDERITYMQYKSFLKDFFMDKVINMNNYDEEKMKEFENKHVFLVNVSISDINFDNNKINFYISSKDEKYVVDNIKLESIMGTQIPIEVDPVDDEELIISSVVIKKKEQEDRYRVDTIGIYTENPTEGGINDLTFEDDPFNNVKESPMDSFLKGEDK